jgi:heme-degrading monooxygenase HmoA
VTRVYAPCTSRCPACASRPSAPTSSSPRSGERIGLVDAFEGFVDLQVWQSDRDPGELTMVSRWRDRDVLHAYMKSREHRRSHDRIDPDLDAAIKLERLEHLHVVAQ